MTTLREIATDVERLFALIEEQDGEILPEQESLLAELQDKMLHKTDAVADFLQTLDERAQMIRAEEVRLAERRKRVEATIERLEGYVLRVLDMTGRQQVVGTLHTLSRRVGPAALVIDDEGDVLVSLPECVITEVVQRIDKAAVKRAIKAGTPVRGAHLESRPYLKRD